MVQMLIVLVSSVTAPLRASAAPQSMVAPVVSVMLGSATIWPWKAVVVPSVAEEPTLKNTLPAWAFPISSIEDALPVIRVDSMLKMKTAFSSPPPSSTRASVPVSPAELSKL